MKSTVEYSWFLEPIDISTYTIYQDNFYHKTSIVELIDITVSNTVPPINKEPVNFHI